ncbi:MAG: SGNH/GDSL hydrolase family protein [Gemmatimonadaceae bacterium]
MRIEGAVIATFTARVVTRVAGAATLVLLAQCASVQRPATTPAAATAASAAAPASAPAPNAADVRLHNDWAFLERYRQANAALAAPAPGANRVVFYGNSITEGWARYFDKEFPGKPYIGRGISGQTTPQMLVRFRQDVVALHPAVVVILAGTNDIAGNTGPSTLEMIEDNFASMTEIAQANHIRVVLSSVLPVYDYPWRPGLQPVPKIAALNAWLRSYAAAHGATYLDYFSSLADERQGMKSNLASDGVHPTEAGYEVMAPLAERAIADALRTPAP